MSRNDRFACMFVALSLVAFVATACGGKDEEASQPTSELKSESAPSAANDDPNRNLVANPVHPLANLTPEETANLKRLRDSVVAKAKAEADRRKPRVQSDFVKIESTGGDAIELPETFSADFPVLAGSIPTRHVTSPTKGTITEFDSDVSVDAARRHFSDSLGKSGWMLISDLSEGGLTMIVAEKDGRDLSVVITEEGGHTKITAMEMP